MWTCAECGRIFKKANQPHSCKKVPLGKHFENKEKAKELLSPRQENVQKMSITDGVTPSRVDIGKCVK